MLREADNATALSRYAGFTLTLDSRLRGNDDRCRVSVMNYVMINRMLCVANAEGGLGLWVAIF